MADQVARALAAFKNSKLRPRFKLTDKDRQYIHDKGLRTIHSHATDFRYTKQELRNNPL
jgi:hypothetical protein